MSNQPHLMPFDREEQLFDEKKTKSVDYRQQLEEKLKNPKFRKIEGFPIGGNESILALSDPPYYTACPNPFLNDQISEYTEQLENELDHRTPFTADVGEGKYHPMYKLHPYQTKVPHRAIMRYILHYTQPGDIVLDGFCGTGMTGIAAQFCGHEKEIRSLGYIIDKGKNIYDSSGNHISKLGNRIPILIDISTSATFLAYNWNKNINSVQLEKESKRVFSELEEHCGWMYTTFHNPSDENVDLAIKLLKSDRFNCLPVSQFKIGKINYTAWSDVFVCPHCNEELVFWDVAVDIENGKINDEFCCSFCKTTLKKSDLERVWENYFDDYLQKTIKQTKRVPVLINYTFNNKRYTKEPDEFDLTLIKYIESNHIDLDFPTFKLPIGDKTGEPIRAGITHVHHFYTKRNLQSLAYYKQITNNQADFLFSITKVASQITLMYRFTHQNGVWGAGGGPLSGTMYIPSLVKELNILDRLKAAIKVQIKTKSSFKSSPFYVSTNSATDLSLLQDNSIDYIFIDPPFGNNLMYSELNFLWEAWIGLLTNSNKEAIANNSQNKKVSDYQNLMYSCFIEFFRVLKPGKWMTLEFHNSKNSIWNAIQESLQHAGFIIADVRTLDKKKKTFKQIVASGSVDQDLIISAYKPNHVFEENFSLTLGTSEGVWEFIRQHLDKLPVVIETDDRIEIIAERQSYLLFDRMVAFHIQRGISIPYSAGEFYIELNQRFPIRDGMFFLPSQVAEYDRVRLKTGVLGQLTYLVTDEKSSIQWLRQILDPQLGGLPKAYQEIQPEFLKLLKQARHENIPELLEILEQNFLQNEEGRWYVPNPNKASDLEKLRNKALLREFNKYLEGMKRLNQFRTEAIRAGFADAWQRKDFATIVKIAERLPETIIQDDPDLLMYYDNASLRVD